MSRVGKLPIRIPDQVKVTLDGDVVSVKGPRTTLKQTIPDGVKVVLDSGVVTVNCVGESRRNRSLHGLVRTLINNMVIGVSTGFTRNLEIVGVGYRVEQKGDFLSFNLGYSHPILYELPIGVEAKIEGTNKISLSASDKELLGQAAATVRAFRPPEPYKGKGIRYADEVIRSKVGKAGAA